MANIRWKKNEKTDLQKLVTSYNSKIKRLANKGYKDAPLPKKESFKQIRDNIVTRKDLENQIELLKSFTARYATNVAEKGSRGAIVPYYVKHQTEIKLEIVNEKRAIQRKLYVNKPVTDRNEPIDPKNRFEDENLSHLEPRQVNFKNMSKKDLELTIESLSNYDVSIEEKNEHYRKNFYKSLKNTLLPEDLDKVIEIIDKVSTDKLVEKLYTDINMKIGFHYEPSEYKALVETIIDSWTKVLNEK